MQFMTHTPSSENIVERAVTLETGAHISRASLPELTIRRRKNIPTTEIEVPPEGIDLERILGDIERDLLMKALTQARGVRKDAAKLLSLTFRSMRYRMVKHGVDSGPDDD